MAEIWKSINGHENYEVSSFGNVNNVNTGRILKACANKDGYYLVGLRKDGKRTTFKVHRLVAEAFIENPLNKKCVDHINNNKTDNNITNLRWASNKENGQNRSMSKNNTSNVKGVSFDKESKKWRARITIDEITVYLGRFESLEDAKQARINRANEAFGIYTNACEKQ
jgi:hypothetical protein